MHVNYFLRSASHTFDKAIGGPEALGDRLHAAADEGHFEAVVVAHEFRRAMVVAVDADVARVPAYEDRYRDRVDVVTPLATRTRDTAHAMHALAATATS